jgi:hypothetical protein
VVLTPRRRAAVSGVWCDILPLVLLPLLHHFQVLLSALSSCASFTNYQVMVRNSTRPDGIGSETIQTILYRERHAFLGLHSLTER